MNSNSKAYGVLYGTPWLLVSLNDVPGNKRNLYDYTNGYDGGSSSTINSHTKSETKAETGFLSPEDGRDYYAVATEDSRNLLTVKASTGVQQLSQSVEILNSDPTRIAWIYDTDLCVVGSMLGFFGVINFMQDSPPSLVVYSLSAASQRILQPAVWKEYRAIAIPAGVGDLTYVYRGVQQVPCSRLCATCDDVQISSCSTCKANSALSGNKCSCDSGFYESNTSYTTTECLACSAPCSTCTGGGPTDCTLCKYSYMELKGDGSCGCPNGKYLLGVLCLDCHSSCNTCSGPGTAECLTCDIPNGKYLSGGERLACHSDCKSCSGGGQNECLSCDTSNQKYLSGATVSTATSLVENI